MSNPNHTSSITEQDLKEIIASLTKIFESDEGKKLGEGIKTISQSAISVTTEFTTVRGILRTFDSKQYKDEDGKPLASLEEPWKVFQTRFNKYLTASRKNALEAKVSAEEYVLFMGEIDDGGEEFVEAEMPGFIKSYLDRIEKALVSSAQTNKDIGTLKDDISRFIANINGVLNLAIPKELKKHEDAIDQIDTNLIHWRGPSGDLAKALNDLAIGDGCAGALALSIVLAPDALQETIIKAISAKEPTTALTSAEAKGKEYQKDRSKKLNDALQVDEKRDQFEEVRAKLAQAETNFKNLYLSVDTITDIWNHLKSDAQKVKTELERSKTDAARKSFVTDLCLVSTLTCAVYRRLGELLGDYAANIKDVGSA